MLKSLNNIPLKYLRVLLSLLLIIATLVVYWPVSHHDFVNYDDDVFIYKNPHIRGGLTLEGITWAFSSGLTINYRGEYWVPVTHISHMVGFELFGMDASGHHVMNAVIHVINTLLFFWVFSQMTGALWRSAFAAALFAVHPLHVESVAWVMERKDVLSALFFFLTLWAYKRYTDHPKWVGYLPVVAGYTLGLMAKPMLVTLPMLLLLLDFWPLNRISLSGAWKESGFKTTIWHLVKEKIPLFGIAAAFSIITYQATLGGGHPSFDKLSFGIRFQNSVVSYASYIQKTLWPSGLAVHYPHPGDALPGWQIAGSGLLLLFISVLAILWIHTRPYLLIGWLWYLGTLFPVIGLIQTGNHAMADRYTYIPLIGVFIILVWGISDILERRPYGRTLLAAGGVLLILVCMALTWRQVGTWSNSVTLFEHAIRVTEQNVIAHNNLGIAYQEQGRLDEAVQQLETAITVKPNDPMAHHNLGFVLSKRDQTDAAIEHYQSALRLNPWYAEARINLGSAYRAQGLLNEAIGEYRLAIAQRPDFAEAHNDLGTAYKEQGLTDQAIQEFRTAIRLNPDLAGAYNNLGISLMERGMTQEAVRYYQIAVGLNPDFAQAHNNLGESLTEQGKLIEAMDEFRMVIEIDPRLWQAHNNLASVFFLLNRFEDAVREYQTALEIDSNPIVAYNLGSAYQRMGRLEEARRAFERALTIDPGFQQATRALTHLPE